MQWHRNAFLEAWGDGDLTRPAVGARDEPLPSRADQRRVLALAVVAVLLGLVLSATATSQPSEQGGPRWQSPACAEQQRLQRHGVRSGPSYRAVARACREATGGR
jgi:hypothetical protein